MKIYSAAVFFLIVMNLYVSAAAEYVFKKDGAIIKGRILSDDASVITMKSDDGQLELIYRKDLLRVLYTDLYLGKVFVRMTSGEVVEGYQVDEDRDVYVFRKDINKPDEFSLPRKKVMFIARTNPTDLSGEGSINEIMIRWSPPFKPAKHYRIYMRGTGKSEKFRLIGETDDNSYKLKDLSKSTSYEVYVTAIGDSGEESLPSEKIVTSTIPYPPGKLNMNEKYSSDGKSVTLTMTWEPVMDRESRVKSYNIYQADDQRKKIGTTKGNEFVIKNFPAEGRHWFAVVAVSDIEAESVDVKAVYDAGYKIYTRASGAYIFPTGNFAVIADSGYGGIVDLMIGAKGLSVGIETGYLSFNGTAGDIKKLSVLPILAAADYRMPLLYSFILRPMIKAGAGYCMVEYVIHHPEFDEIYEKKEFNPMGSAGAFLDYDFSEDLSISCGTEYSAVFQESGTNYFISVSVGVTMIF